MPSGREDERPHGIAVNDQPIGIRTGVWIGKVAYDEKENCEQSHGRHLRGEPAESGRRGRFNVARSRCELCVAGDDLAVRCLSICRGFVSGLQVDQQFLDRPVTRVGMLLQQPLDNRNQFRLDIRRGFAQ